MVASGGAAVYSISSIMRLTRNPKAARITVRVSSRGLPRSDDQVVARNSSRSTRRSVASSGSFLRLVCSRKAALMRLW